MNIFTKIYLFFRTKEDNYETGSDSDVCDGEVSELTGKSQNSSRSSPRYKSIPLGLQIARSVGTKPTTSHVFQPPRHGEDVKQQRHRTLGIPFNYHSHYSHNGIQQNASANDDKIGPVHHVTVTPGKTEGFSNGSGPPVDSKSEGTDSQDEEDSSWRSQQTVPILLLGLLAVFFGLLAIFYVNMTTPLLPMLKSFTLWGEQLLSTFMLPFLAPYKQLEGQGGQSDNRGKTFIVLLTLKRWFVLHDIM